MVECQLPKLKVASSILVTRSSYIFYHTYSALTLAIMK